MPEVRLKARVVETVTGDVVGEYVVIDWTVDDDNPDGVVIRLRGVDTNAHIDGTMEP